MAPALTQASDPQTFHVSGGQHSPARPGDATPTAQPQEHHLALGYGGLKEPHACTDAHLAKALANGTRRPVRLPPPSPPAIGGLACGREGPDPPPHAALTTMDPPPGPLASPHQSPKRCDPTATMGQDTVPQPGPQPQPPVPPLNNSQHKSPRPPSHDGDLLALIGRDFANMNEIIETLTSLADNPEVLAAVDTAGLNLAPTPDAAQTTEVLAPPLEERPMTREERASVLLPDLDRRQQHIGRRQTRLLRRLRRVTARGLGASVSGQLRELLDHAHGALASQREQSTTPSEAPEPTESPEVGVEALRADAMRTMSTSALVNLVRRVEASQGLARLAAASHRPPRTRPHSPAPALPHHTRQEVAAVGAEVEAATHAHTHHDSDATESSSGGESCDEADGYNNANRHHTHISERALYRYCRARSWVASRWTWLQAQVADLEYRILQQQKIYAHVRTSKGAVQVEEGRGWRGMTLRDPAHVDVHDPALTCLSAPVSRTTVNGYHGRVDDAVAAAADSTYVAARTQGLRAIKRRRLVRAGAGLCAGHRRGVGGGRIPAVQCKCVLPLTCVLCTRLQGLTPPTAPPDPDTQPWSERHARVDPSFHQVLSQPTDVSLSERFDTILKTTDWQKQVLTAKTLQPLPVTRTSRESPHLEKKKKKDKDRKKEYKKHKKEGKGRITLKLKKSLLTGELVRDGNWYKRKRISTQEPLLAIKKVRVDDDDDGSSVYGSSLQSSPSASPAPIDRSAHKRHSSSSSSQKNKQSTSANSYDIDNIVIPYSMAASTRVEKLEYKEIPTPKWRIVPLIPNNIHCSASHEEEDEDISEAAIVARHNRSEELERKKFLHHLHMQVTSRSSRSRRTDSSGTNTPDHPLSPRPADPASDTISPLATPPTTPLAPSEDSNQSSSLSAVPSSGFATSFSTFCSSSQQPSSFNTISHASSQLVVQNLQYTPSTSTTQGISLGLSSQLATSTSSSMPASSHPSAVPRRNRTFSTGSRSRGFFGCEEGFAEKAEGFVPYEQRVFPLNNAEYLTMVRETEDCDIGPPSPPLDASSHEPTNMEESGRSSPMSEVTDSAPEDDGQFDDSAEPKWTISGLKDATGQCVLQIQRN